MLTTDPTDSRLGHGSDDTPRKQSTVYLVLSDAERAKGFVRPYRDAYVHTKCTKPPRLPDIAITSMGRELSATYARDPEFYGSTYCIHCAMHKPVGEFNWYETDGLLGPVVGS